MIWRKQGTSPNGLRCFSDVTFTCHRSCQLESSLAPSSLLASKRSQNCQKNACILLLNYSTRQKQGTSPNRLLCFSDVMFTCQDKLGEFMPASKLPSTFILPFIEGIFMPLNRQLFSTPTFMKILANKR